MTPDLEIPSDAWSRWILHDRSGGDEAYESLVRAGVREYIDHLLARAQLTPGMTLLDIGAGDGEVALQAIERVGPELRVLLTDISAPLLRRAQARAQASGVAHQCRFLLSSADSLTDIPDESVDVVTSRAVLAYVGNKRGAIRSLHRVLKPGGCLTVAEPIFQDDAVDVSVLKTLAEREGEAAAPPLARLLYRLKAAQYPDTPAEIAASPLTNFNERTFLVWLQEAGFFPVHVQLHLDLVPSPVQSWAVYLHTSPHPLAPTPATILDTEFTAEERRWFESALRPLIEAGRGTGLQRVVYFQATKPKR